MRHEAIHSFGCLCNAKPAVLCELYYCITGDSLASTNVQQEQVDECVRLALDCKDEDIIWDLCEKNEEKLAKYDVFWDHCQKYIDSKLEAAADEWRHDTCVHFAVAIADHYNFISMHNALMHHKKRWFFDTAYSQFTSGFYFLL